MKPTLEEYREGSTRWNGEHMGICYELSHHSISEYSYEGIWNYYIFLHESLFVEPEDFEKFYIESEVSKFTSTYYENYRYLSLYDLIDVYGGITFYESGKYLERSDGEYYRYAKIGCDFNHSWDHDNYFWQRKDDVEGDCKNSIKKFLVENNIRLKKRCKYSGKLDLPEKFYIAKNGANIHLDSIPMLDIGWQEHYIPADDQSEEIKKIWEETRKRAS